MASLDMRQVMSSTQPFPLSAAIDFTFEPAAPSKVSRVRPSVAVGPIAPSLYAVGGGLSATFGRSNTSPPRIQTDVAKTSYISPNGNGIDCVRTWESLYVGTVPLVPRSPVTEHHPDLLLAYVPHLDYDLQRHGPSAPQAAAAAAELDATLGPLLDAAAARDAVQTGCATVKLVNRVPPAARRAR